MGKRLSRSALLVILFAAPAWAGEIRGECAVRFEGTSTLHDFGGTARCEPFRATFAREPGGRTVVHGAQVLVPVAGMDTKNGSRDRQMREMFESDRFPWIRATVPEVDADRIRREAKPGSEAGTLELGLTIRDTSRRVEATVSNLREEPGKVSFDLTLPVSLKEFGLKAPSVWGIIRVGDRVTVRSSVTLDLPEPR